MFPLLVSTLLLSVAVLSAAEVTIQTLNGNKTFNDFIQGDEFAFVLFNFPDSSPLVFGNYKEAAEELTKVNTNVKFANLIVGTDDTKGLRLEYIGGVYAFDPRLFCFKKNKKLGDKIIPQNTYALPTKDVLAWMKEMIKPPSFWRRVMSKTKE